MTLFGVERGYEDLANAIIIQAVEDYRCALRNLTKHPEDSGLLEVKDKLEEFFNSDWYAVLTDVEGSYLMQKVREEEGYECDVEIS